MHFMSVKQYNSYEVYLAKQFLDWVQSDIQAGYRYQFKSPDKENSKLLYEALVSLSENSMEDSAKNTLPFVECGGVRLLPVLHGDDETAFSENYISHLRDEVAGRSGLFENTALLIIHNSMLDTLINSAKNLADHDAIWSPKAISEKLNLLIQSEKKEQRALSKCLLEDQLRIITEDGATIFGFKKLYLALDDGRLDFDELELIDDPLILSYDDPAKIRKRLDLNRKMRGEIKFATEHFSDQLENSLTNFSNKFIKQNFNDANDWQRLPLEDFIQEEKKNKEQVLTFEELTAQAGESPLFVIDRPKSQTKNGLKDLSILLQTPQQESQLSLNFVFEGADLEKNQIKLMHNPHIKDNATLNISRAGGKKSKVSLDLELNNEPTYFTLELKREKRSEEYKFRFLIVRDEQFYFEDMKSHFLIDSRKQRVILQQEDSSIKISNNEADTYELSSKDDIVDINEFSKVNFESLAEQSDEVEFRLKSGEVELAFYVEGSNASSGLKVPLLFAQDKIKKLFSDKENAEYNRTKKKIVYENSEYVVAGVRSSLLELEASLLDQNILFSDENNEILQIQDFSVSFPTVANAYQALFDYYNSNGTTPSLVAWGENYCSLVQHVLDAFEYELKSIDEHQILSSAQKQLMSIGLIKKEVQETIAPFHPLVLVYHLNLAKNIKADRDEHDHSSFADLPAVTLERLTASGLMPFVYHKNSSFAHVQAMKENSFWLNIIPQKDASHSYVKRLVKDKLKEFSKAYSRLFKGGAESALIINAINQGTAKELFAGLVDHFKHDVENATAVHVNFYDEKLVKNEFDNFANSSSFDELKEALSLKSTNDQGNSEILINTIRRRLTYSKFTTPKEGEDLAYAHLSFFKNNAPVDCRDVKIEEALSGVLCDGLIAGDAAELKEGAFFTAFGLRNVNTVDQQSLRLAKLIGSLWKPARQDSCPYNGLGTGLAVSESFRELLNRSYDSSLWTTIIDPKVTLDFFTSQSDVVLIHYSDQYTSNSGYDAITVTKQVNLFQSLLHKDSTVKVNRLLAEFNAFNGEWLLKMLTAKEKDRKEKHGIIAAYKFVSSMFRDSDICWVPLSVEEIIRVSGNVGLKMNESDFARKNNKGSISDDVLFVGFKDNKLYLMPLEVKAGSRPDFKKAGEQAKELKRYLREEILAPDNLASRMYRSLFIRQVLMQVEKFRLYEVIEDSHLEELLEHREEWLTGKYQVAELPDYVDGLVLAHIDSNTCFSPEFKRNDNDILQIELPYDLIPQLISAETKEQLNNFVDKCSVPSDYMLKVQDLSDIEETTLTLEKPEIEAEEVLTSNDELTEEIIKAVEKPKEQLKIQFGEDTRPSQDPVYWEPTNTSKVMNTNTGIIGTMGTGKTQFTKSVLTQLHRNRKNNVEGTEVGVLVFDYKSDYVDDEFLKATNGSKHRLYNLPYNPLSLFGDTPMLPVHTASGFSETMAKAYGLGKKQQLKLENLILEAYAKAGISEFDESTWSKPAPTIDDVWELFLDQEKVEEDSLFAALSKLARLKIFETDQSKISSLYDLINGVTVIELAKYPAEIQSLVVALTLDLFYSQMQRKGKPTLDGDYRQITKMILVDEADTFMSQNFLSLRKILKEGREYGVGVILSTQDLSHFKTNENDYSSYIMTWIIHRVAQIKPQDIRSIFNTSDKNDESALMQQIRELDKHYSLYVDGEKHIMKIKDLAFWEIV